MMIRRIRHGHERPGHLLQAIVALWLTVLPVVVLGQEAVQHPPGKVYWSDRGTNEIFRSDFDGANPELLLSGDDVPGGDQFRGLALDDRAGVVYFCDNSSKQIYRFAVDGSRQVESIAEGIGFPADITLDLDGGKVYWCDQIGGVIERVNFDGSGREVVVTTPQPYFLTLDKQNGKLYWGDFSAGNIFRANLTDGSDLETIVSDIAGRTRGVQLDPTEGKLYWVTRNEGKIQRRDLAGGPVEDIYVGLDTPHGLTLDLAARKIYWADTGSNPGSGSGENLVSRGDMDGSGGQELLSAGSADNDPWDIVLDTRPAPFSRWQARFFRKGRGENAAQSSDPDRDGLVNIQECALGSHPLLPDFGGRAPRPVVIAGDIGIEFVRAAPSPPGVTITVEQSQDLLFWSEVGVVLDSVATAAMPDRERVRYLSHNGPYVRLRVTE